MMAFNLGARVSFETEAGRVVGRLIKRNRKTANVAWDNGRQYRFSPRLACCRRSKTSTLHQPLSRSGRVSDYAEVVGMVNNGLE